METVKEKYSKTFQHKLVPDLNLILINYPKNSHFIHETLVNRYFERRLSKIFKTPYFSFLLKPSFFSWNLLRVTSSNSGCQIRSEVFQLQQYLSLKRFSSDFKKSYLIIYACHFMKKPLLSN